MSITYNKLIHNFIYSTVHFWMQCHITITTDHLKLIASLIIRIYICPIITASCYGNCLISIRRDGGLTLPTLLAIVSGSQIIDS